MVAHLSRWLRLLAVAGLVLPLAIGVPLVGVADDDECEIVDDDGDSSTDGYCDDQAIVQLVPGAEVGDIAVDYEEVIGQVPSRNIYLLSLPSGSNERAVVQELAGDQDVNWAELNFTDQVPEGRPRRLYLRGDSVPGGPGTSYAPRLLGVREANRCATGRGVTVAVIDSGIDDTHPAFAGHLLAGHNVLPDLGPEKFQDVGNGNDDDGDGHVDEMVGHGTHVAGIVLQVAPAARILPIRALDSDGAGDAFFLAAAIYHALDRNAKVINLSLGTTQNPRVVREAVLAATRAGVLVAAAAGNENRQAPAEYPAVGGQALGVAATDARDRKSTFSNFHPTLAISAPGTKIVSAYPGGEYRTWSGTSMAAPWVSGAAALLLDDGLSARQAANRLAATAVDLDGRNPAFAGKLGAGRLDVAAAVGCGR